MGELLSYSEYKEADELWLGRIPVHWNTTKTKYLFSERTEKGYPSEPLLAATQTKGVVPKSMYENRTVVAQKDLHLLKLVEKGDFVISLRSFEGGIEYAYFRGIISPAYTILVPSAKIDPGYFRHVFKSARFIHQLFLYVTGIREGQNIDYSRLSRAEMPLPPLSEQTAIARYLDHQNHLINRYIRARRKLITLLEAQKQAIIQQAVTRGLNPDAPMKDSGVEWLGEVPEGWEVIPLKLMVKIQSGVTLGKVYLNTSTQAYPYLRVANVQAGYVDLSTVKTISLPASEAFRSILQKGDVLMTEGGDPDKLGRGCVWEDQINGCLHQNHIFAVRPNKQRLNPYYLQLVLGSKYTQTYFMRTAKQTTNLASTNKTTIGQFPVPLPPSDEQETILQVIQERTHGIDQTIALVNQEIALIREYRTRLIADVVTGKLDVREAAARLPEWVVEAPADTEAEELDLEEDEDMGEEADEENEEEI